MGKFLFALRHLVLERHPLALRAAEAAECSSRAGKFWALHDELFKRPMAIDEESILEKAGRIGVDSVALRACLDSGPRQRIEEDVAHAKELGISSTPSFLIGIVQPDWTVMILRHESGAIPGPVFAKMLDDALETARISSQ